MKELFAKTITKGKPKAPKKQLEFDSFKVVLLTVKKTCWQNND